MSTDKNIHDEPYSVEDKEDDHTNASFNYDEVKENDVMDQQSDHLSNSDDLNSSDEHADEEEYHFHDENQSEIKSESTTHTDSENTAAEEDEEDEEDEEETQVNKNKTMHDVLKKASVYAQKAKDAFLKLSKPQRRIVTIIGGVIILLIVLHLFALMGEKSHSDSHTNTSQPAKSAVSMNVMPGSAKYVSPNALDSMKQSFSGQLETVVGQSNRNQQAVQDMQQQLQQMQDSINSMAAQQREMQSQVAKFSQQAAVLLAAKSSSKKEQKNKPVKIIVPISYHLEAIEPGRAWIIDSNGNSTTARVGDKLAQYGRVMSINADEGQVLTSSGKVIGYGSNDS